jgi:ATP-dependent helicase/nuclease subunit B
MRRRNVFTIPPGAPFLATFVDAFLAGEIVDRVGKECSPLALARATIYVPTRRAGRALATQFACAMENKAALLPFITPLGELDESADAALFTESVADFDPDAARPVAELERRLLLARLISTWAQSLESAIVSIGPDGQPHYDVAEPFLVASSPAGAYALASDLGALIDELNIEEISVGNLNAIVDADFDRYWSITTQFLDIALRQWPEILAARGLVDAVTRHKALVERRTQALAIEGDVAPVIALGSTGTQPATARLLAAIAARTNGAVILPGLDLEMSEKDWARVGATEGEPAFSHPQTMLKRLLSTMRVTRAEVRELDTSTPERAVRRRLIAVAMAPAETTSDWLAYRAASGGSFSAALENISVVEAPDERIEALALALFMRETLETPQRTAALITPDRVLARRVANELRRFDLVVDDSGGATLAATGVGELARRIAGIIDEGLTPLNLAAILAHPLAAFGRTRAEIALLGPLVEIGVLRWPGAGAGGWSKSLPRAREEAGSRRAHPAARAITEAQWSQIETLVPEIEAICAPFAVMREERALASWTQAHRSAFDAIANGADDDASEGASTLFELFERLTDAEAPPHFDPSGYAAFFGHVISELTLRGPMRAHPRLKILGPLEARLIDADRILIAGLDEGVWPPQADTGAFLNRSMRQQIGLTPPERRIGQSAHDFVMAMGAEEVILSRALKRDGSPTVPSRFLIRLEALAGVDFTTCKKRGAHMCGIAAALDRPAETVAVARPAPRPSITLRPKRLSVTRIERLRRDPYAIYAEYILRLKPMPPLDSRIGAREMGTAIHAAIAAFVTRYPVGSLPENGRAELEALARQTLAPFFIEPDFETFLWPRLVEGLAHVYAFECERRLEPCRIFVEAHGEWKISLDDGSVFLLTADADRIEIAENSDAWVFDYKTGAPPNNKQVLVGWSPQLTLEAAMIEAGAFHDIGRQRVAGAAYVGLKSGGTTTFLEWKQSGLSFTDVVARHRDELRKLLFQFRDEKTPYLSRPFVAFRNETGDYDHLARVREWSRGAGDDV